VVFVVLEEEIRFLQHKCDLSSSSLLPYRVLTIMDDNTTIILFIVVAHIVIAIKIVFVGGAVIMTLLSSLW
jgi:hypothetical protein